jgi:membrane-associated phospholipid phosphatase
VGRLTLRRSEWVLAAYFLYAAIVAQVLPIQRNVALLTLGLNASIIASYVLLAHVDSLRRRRFFSIVRDWYPTPLLVLAYREMGWFAPPQHSFELEKTWVVWDKFFLNTLGVKSLIECLGPVLPSLLEISYILVYAVPYFSLGVLYAYHRQERVDRFLFPFALAVLLAYALFPFFPSEPPRTVFPGEDFPSWMTVFRQLNWKMLGAYGIHTSVFPSAHCSGAFCAAFAMRMALPEKQWAWRFLSVMAVMIATATVYGRYHYLADAAAGLAIAVFAMGVPWLLENRRRSALAVGRLGSG